MGTDPGLTLGAVGALPARPSQTDIAVPAPRGVPDPAHTLLSWRRDVRPREVKPPACSHGAGSGTSPSAHCRPRCPTPSPVGPVGGTKPGTRQQGPLSTETKDRERASFSRYDAVKMCKAKCCKNFGQGRGGGGVNTASRASAPQKEEPRIVCCYYKGHFPPIKRVIFVYGNPGQFSI